MILPYLHERRIYLNQKKVNTNYFYTSVQTKISDIESYNANLSKDVSKRVCLPIVINPKANFKAP